MRLVLYVLEKLQTAFKCGKSSWVDKKKKKKRQPKRYLYCYDHLHDSHRHCLLDSYSVLYTEQILYVSSPSQNITQDTHHFVDERKLMLRKFNTFAQSHGANLSEFRPMHFVLHSLLGGESSLLTLHVN